MEQSILIIPMHNPENGAYCAAARVRLQDGRARVEARPDVLSERETLYLITDRGVYRAGDGGVPIKGETVCGLAFMNGRGQCRCGGMVRGKEALYEKMLVRLRLDCMAKKQQGAARTDARPGADTVSSVSVSEAPEAEAAAAPDMERHAEPVTAMAQDDTIMQPEAKAAAAPDMERHAEPVTATAAQNDAIKQSKSFISVDVKAVLSAACEASAGKPEDEAVQAHAPLSLAIVKPRRPMRESAPADVPAPAEAGAANQPAIQPAAEPEALPVAAQADDMDRMAEHMEVSGSEPAFQVWNMDFLPDTQHTRRTENDDPFAPDEGCCVHPDACAGSGATGTHPCRRPMKRDEQGVTAPHDASAENKTQGAVRLPMQMQPQRVDNPFPRQFPGATWVRVNRLQGQGYYYEGRMRQGSGVMTITAAPGEYSPVPPMHLQGFTRFIKTKEGGFWVRVRQPRQ